MKVRVLALVFVVVILFCGCQPASVENTNTVSPTPTNTVIKGKSSDVIIENGEYFLKVYDGKLWGSYDIRGSNCAGYSSVEQIKTAIKTNNFPGGAIGAMYNTFSAVGGDMTLPAMLPIIDPDKIVIPVFNGETDYFRVGFLNRALMADMKITFDGAEYRLNFDTYYMGLEAPNYGKNMFTQALQAGNYTEHLQYTEDGISKQALIYSDGHKQIQYETEIKEIKYYVLEQYEHGSDKILYNVQIFGTVENIGSFRLTITPHNERYIDKAVMQWIMESIELKKA